MVFKPCEAERLPRSSSAALTEVRSPWVAVGANFHALSAGLDASFERWRVQVHTLEGNMFRHASLSLPEHAGRVSASLGLWHATPFNQLHLLVPFELGSFESGPVPSVYRYPWDLEQSAAGTATALNERLTATEGPLAVMGSAHLQGASYVLLRQADQEIALLRLEDGVHHDAIRLGVAARNALLLPGPSVLWVVREHDGKAWVRPYSPAGQALAPETQILGEVRAIFDLNGMMLKDGSMALVWRQGPSGPESRVHIGRYSPADPGTATSAGAWRMERVVGDSGVGSGTPRLARLGDLPLVVYRTHPADGEPWLFAQLYNDAAEAIFEPTPIAAVASDVSSVRVGASTLAGVVVTWNELVGSEAHAARLTCF